MLQELAGTHRLDSKLAEYAFFPLAQQVFNESKRLSPRCLEVAIECVSLLVKHGYRQNLVPALGKQLLILMVMLAGGGPDTETQTISEELKAAAFKCIVTIIEALGSSADGKIVFEDHGTKNILDQLTYLLVEVLAQTTSEQTQLQASAALSQLFSTIQSRVSLASLLPRTISALVKTLKPSTKIRRTQKILVANLSLFQQALNKVLTDEVNERSTLDEKKTLDASWLQATSVQIKNALVQVCKLRTSESSQVRNALEELCLMVIEQCHVTLKDSMTVAFDTLVVLSASEEGKSAKTACRHLAIAYPDTLEVLKESFTVSSQSLPRIMHSQDDLARQTIFRKITAALPLLTESGLSSVEISRTFLPLFVQGTANFIQDISSKITSIDDATTSIEALVQVATDDKEFQSVLLNHQSQQITKSSIMQVVKTLQQQPDHLELAKALCNMILENDEEKKLASFWLALELLKTKSASIEDFFVDVAVNDQASSRTQLLSDLHANTFSMLSTVFESNDAWQLQALSVEALVLYADTFPGDSYRPELVDTLYPVLSFLASPNAMLRSHSITALNKLAKICQYSSVQDLLVQNADYLVNSIAWKLNTYNLSPEAPQLLRMMVMLCGTEIVPYVDDLVQLIFAGLDNFHGYPDWVELLFTSLKALVDVSVKQPLAITQTAEPSHSKAIAHHSTTSDVLDDLRARKRRKSDFDRPWTDAPSKAPQRPWTDALDGPSFPETADSEEVEAERDDNRHLSPMPPAQDEEKKLTKAHTLLLSIATSTVPHLASPSHRVRHLLLDILKDISPLLARDENTFLPLVNAVWPVVVPRLFADKDSGEEVSYNIAAAADTIGLLCVSAGDFMSSRIEEISEQLFQLIESIQQQNQPSRTKALSKESATAVDMQIVRTTKESASQQLQTHPQIRTSNMQVLDALLNLLIAVIGHVRLTRDTMDHVINLLLPHMSDKKEIRLVLESANADMVWLHDVEHMNSQNSKTVEDVRIQTNDEIPENTTAKEELSIIPMPILQEQLSRAGYGLIPAR